MNDRLPPQSQEAEMGVLGCILLSPVESIEACTGKTSISEDAFYDRRHGALFEHMVAMHAAMVPVDLITVQERLKSANLLDACGGLAYLSSLMDAVPSAANLPYYLEIVREKHVLRGLLKAATNASDAVFTGGKKADELVSEHLGQVELLTKADISGTSTAKEVTRSVIDSLRATMDGTAPPSIKTKIDTFDNKAGGLWAGDLVVFAARPSVGKTALMIQLIQAAAQEAYPCGVFSAEMSAKSLVERVIGGSAGVNTREVAHWREGEYKAFAKASSVFANLPIFIDDTSRITIEKIRAITREWVKKHGVKVIGVDYVQLLTTDKKADIREQEVAHISSTLKQIARENNITVIALAQLNRESEKKGAGKPKLAQMRESGALEQDADVAGLLYRDDADEEAGEAARYTGQPFKVVLDIQKNRYGAVFPVQLLFHPKSQKMSEICKVDLRET
jgi:replicative DNA helicase